MSFATIVTHDTPGWDEVSRLDRLGVFRLNLHVGRNHVPTVSDGIDYGCGGMVLPHPQYARQGWVSIVNPTDPVEVGELARRAWALAAGEAKD